MSTLKGPKFSPPTPSPTSEAATQVLAQTADEANHTGPSQAEMRRLDQPTKDATSPGPPPIYPLPRGQGLCLLVIAAGVVLYALYTTRAIAFPIALSVLIALPLRPLVRLGRRLYLPNALGSALVVALLAAVLLGGTAALLEPAKTWVAAAPENLRKVESKLRRLKGPFVEMQEVGESVERLAQNDQQPATLEVEVKQPSLTSAVLSTTGNVLVGTTITVSLVFLLLAFGDRLIDAVVQLLPTRGDRRNLRHLTFEAERSISRFLLTYTVINAGLGLVIGTGMWLLGLPNPVLWGVMAACLNYIPFVGLAVGTTVVFLVGVISFDSLPYALLAPAIYLAANGLEANIVTPLLLGHSLKLNVILIFLAIILWGWMWGIGGALIAVPLLLVAKVISDHFENLRVVSKVLGA